MRKKIALLAGQPDENYQSMFIKGFISQAFENNLDVCVFAMYKKYQNTKTKEQGEANIFSLVEYDLFDAIVVLADTIQTPGVLDHLEEELHKKYQKPVIFVDKESKYFKTIVTDNYTPVKQLISHLIEKHGFDDIAFVTGKEFHPHSKQRLQGFLDCIEEHGLEVKDNRIFYGDFWYNSGVGVAERLLRNRDRLPQAVACANDYMAIGVATELAKFGIRVPEDIAVTGYDLTPEGKTSPAPVTSAPIPAEECGIHAVKCVMACLAGEEIPEFEAKVDLFIGRSCGCEYGDKESGSRLRSSWETGDSKEGFDSVTSFMEDDLLVQTEAEGLINTVFSYVHQIRPFNGFHLCMNTDWMEENAKMGAYTGKMIDLLKCGEEHKGTDRVDFDAKLDRKELLNSLMEEGEEPHAYILTPLFFEKHCFGYAAINYGNEMKSCDETYKKWLAVVMRGLECFRRINLLTKENAALKAGQVRDSLTGFYNYNGFVERAASLLEEMPGDYGYADIVAVELCGIGEIYKRFSIQDGNQVVVDFAEILSEMLGKRFIGNLGNGEFMLAKLSSKEQENDMEGIEALLQKKIEEYNTQNGLSDKLFVVTGQVREQAGNTDDFEDLINEAVSRKNGNKVKLQKQRESSLTVEEQQEAELVTDILDNNRLVYHFQPIVDANTGEIFAYEALMRANIEGGMSPLKILKHAEHLQRLYDVEKATFMNILHYIESHEEQFENKKVFINSIPGCPLKEEDADIIREKLRKYNGKVVVELTEQAELDDEQLEKMKKIYEDIGIDIAVDDYGTGYSNVSNLLRYMPDYVKIDRMLLAGIQLSSQKQHFVKEIIEYAHDNNIKALAEGVETAEELKTVIALGADLIQGYYTARPSDQVVVGVDMDIQNEIIQYGQLALEQSGRKVYQAGQESNISLVKLVTGHYVRIQCGGEKMAHRDIVIAGLPGFQANMDLVIEDNYKGRIELRDVDFAKYNDQPTIEIGENCDVTLVLTGNNILEQGGILVPESSKLTVQGDGNLLIKQIAVDGYGIGNGNDKKHGDLFFEQDGAIEIGENTMHAVGIGAGLGGNIYINRGSYVMHLAGEEAVGIGSLYADVNLFVHTCGIEFNIANATSVGIGSLKGGVTLDMAFIGFKGFFSANRCVCIGTMEGSYFKYKVNQVTINLNGRCQQICGIGSFAGDVDLHLDTFSFNISVQGKEAIAMGNLTRTATIYAKNGNLITKVKNNLDTDIGAEKFDIINGICDFTLNGETVVRENIEGEL